MDNQHKSLKLKKVIKRMEDLEDNTRRLWIDEILHKFGEDFGFNQESSTTRLYHTKEDLVNAGFEWMFSCPGFNVEEVE